MSAVTPPSLGGGGGVGADAMVNAAATVNSIGAGASVAAGGVAAVSSAASDHFCLRWNNYQMNMTAVFDQLLQEEVFVDVTLSCEGGAQLRAHKVVLAACSPYFQAVLQNNPCKHPIIILPRDVLFSDLRAIIEFVYRGEIDVAQEQINSLLQAAETLKIKGLCEVGDDPSNIPPGFTATSSTGIRQHSLPPSASKGRPSLTRGRYTPYKPRGRPPLYGRNRYERGSLMSRSQPTREMHDRQAKRIKSEDTDDDSSVGGVSSLNDVTGQHRTHHLHYQTTECHNDDSAGTSHTAASEYDGYPYVKPEETHLAPDGADPSSQRMTVTPELLGLIPSNSVTHYSSDSESVSGTSTGRKLWTDDDMNKALDALRSCTMSLSRAAHIFGIPATTLWQRAHRMGIETPKKEGPNKTWSEHDLSGALEELRSGRMSANRASKEFGIPNSTLYKIARKEGIKLSSPFSAIQPSWNPDDLNRALDAIRGGMSVQKAATEYGIPTGTLYGRCRREGIELSKYQGVPWSEEDMKDALEAVRVGEMSINQAAIHYNLPYSSLYGRFKRGKYEDGLPHHDFLQQEMTIEHYSTGAEGAPQQAGTTPQTRGQPQQQTPPPLSGSRQQAGLPHAPEQY